ncbi:23S rRNA (pseudouridine1915-N3)-methyltransferase [Rhizobiales bacterium GAS113]|nr:23S rRNA (pseudouridine1915-N3)-methyltransferase [Rhizobiales bacterium GAS113]
MKLVICAVGRLKAGPERDLAERYEKRARDLAPKLGLSGPMIVELAEGRARDEATRRREEWVQLAAKSEGVVRVALDERGRTRSSAEFAKSLVGYRDGGAKALAFLIGGADGLSAEGREAASEVISFGAMTLPHQLVRIVLLEQIYRALTIRLGHPYHRL